MASISSNKIIAIMGAERSLSIRAELTNAEEACDFITQIISAVESVFSIDVSFDAPVVTEDEAGKMNGHSL